MPAMFTKNSLGPVFKKVDLLIAEVKHVRSAGPHFRILHRLHMPGGNCLPGEEITAVFLVHRGYEIQLPLSGSQRLIFDYLAHHSRIAQSAKQIEIGIRASAFYREHAENAGGKPSIVKRIPRSAVREHVKRLHHALAVVFHEANLPIDPRRVLVINETMSNEVGYQLRATCRWTHIDLTARNPQRVWN